MERRTVKHSPRMDEQLEHEQQALTHGAPDEGRTEPRRTEGPGPDEPGAVATSAQERRAALAATFRPSVFPARPAELAAQARDAFADDDLVAAIEALPDRPYETVSDLDRALVDQRPDSES